MLRSSDSSILHYFQSITSILIQTRRLSKSKVQDCVAGVILLRLMTFLLLALICSVTGRAQQFSNTDGSSPSGMEPGAPAGSFPLSGFENINYYNGSLNVSLPILTVGGRGGAQFTVPLNVRTHPWRVSGVPVTQNPTCFIYYAQNHWWQQLDPDPNYGAGTMMTRFAGSDVTNDPLILQPIYTLMYPQLSFTAPNGTEYNFYDQKYNGSNQFSTTFTTHNFGRVFIARQNAQVTFVSDLDITINNLSQFDQNYPVTGWMYLPDGMRYRISGGVVREMIDRNGNKIVFTHDSSGRVLTITDSLNHLVTFAYNVNMGAPYGTGDLITFKGSGGATRYIRVTRTTLGEALRPGFSINNNLFPQYPEPSYNPNPSGVPKTLWLPDDRKYEFRYNDYGEVARIELPTGGAIEYDWAAGVVNGPASGAIGRWNDWCFVTQYEPGIYRRVIERRIYKDLNSSIYESRETISRPESINPALAGKTDEGYQNSGAVEVNTYDYNGILVASGNHTFHPVNNPYRSITFNQLGYNPPWWEGKEILTETFATNGSLRGPLLRREEFTLGFGHIDATTTTLSDTNLVTKKTFSYDQYNNQIDIHEYDFGPGVPGPLLRHTHTDYLTTNPFQGNVNYATDLNIHIRNLPTYTSISDGNGVEISKTWFDYDAYGINGLPALQDCPGIVQHDGGFHTGYGARGNLVKTTRLATSTPTYVYQHFFYDIAGNVVQKLDGRGIPTMIDFSDRFGPQGDDAQSNAGAPELAGGFSYAFPTKVTNYLGHTVYTKYDYYLGKPSTIEDENKVVSSISYNDALDRPTQSIQARYVMGVGIPAVRRQTTMAYDDANHMITTTRDRDTFGDNILTAKVYYDGLGRTCRSAVYEGSTWTITDTLFDALGRVSQVSNQYRAADPGSASPPPGSWTTSEYDALGRPIKGTTPDGAQVDTAYSGNQVTVTDQVGKKRLSKTDALGRLVEVIEDPGGLGHVTSYLYDALGNLRKVTQGAQNRWFAYDSLSRLIRAKNPEQDVNADPNVSYADPVTGHNGWSMAYKYDENGNLKEKTDARNVKTSYEYDALNRNTSVNYSNTTVNPDITRFYDKPDPLAYGKGRYWHDYSGGGWGTDPNVDHTAVDSYDPLGRPRIKRQLFIRNGIVSPTYSANQTYDLAGNVKTMTYPSDRTVNYSYDNAGRLSSFTGNLGDGQLRTYSTITQYHPAGMIERETFGTQTPLHHKKRYNNRLQLGDLRLSTGSDALSYDRGALLFLRGPNAVASNDPLANDPTNNGNLVKQLHYVPIAGGGEVIPQADTYTYDALNRISSVVEPNVFTQTYVYDQFGNRRINSATGPVNNYNPTYDTGRNRIVGPGYDQAGNITSDLLTGGTMTYDAESRMLTASAGGGGAYTYDASGKRTRRTEGGQETWYIYGVGGELLAEYAANGAPSAPQKEYGYRGGQILIVAESGSGGGVSLVKPDSQSRSDLIGKIGPGTGGAANRIFSADEPFAALGINEGYGSITAGFLDNDRAGTPVRGGPRAPAEEYVNAPSANGAGGEVLVERPAGTAPSAPQKEYGYRGGRSLSLAAAQSSEVVWVDDAVPAGAVATADWGDSWNWVSSSPAPKSGSVSHISNLADWSNWSPPPYSGNVSHQSSISSGLHQHYYHSSPTPIPVRYGGTLYAYIFMDPENPPQQVMLQWGTYTDGWEHRAYWGANLIGWGTDGTASRRYMGPLPAAGGWVRLEVPASAVGLEGMTVGAMAFTLYGGRANWDLAGISGVNVWDEWVCVWNGWDYDCYWQHHEDYENFVLVDDSFPAGAASGADGGDSWNWRGANNVDLVHQHYFYNASDTLQVGAGDKLFTWVYLDPAYPPQQVMLQWNENGSWEHRAYWGANKIGWGTDGTASRRYMGSLPPAGQWVRLEVEASAVGLEGKTLNGMAFTLYGGRASWDKAGKMDAAPVISNVAAGGITISGATITWSTNEGSDSQVEYGPTTAYGQSTTLNPALVTAHSQGLSGLVAGTLYHYRVKSKDAAGSLAISGDFTFTTAQLVISNVAAGGITSSGATITWTTNYNSDSQVEYGTTTAYGQSTTLNPALVTAHSQGLSGLTGGTLYHYRVKSRDAAGNLAVSGDFTLTTAPDTTPPTVTSFFPAAGATNVVANANVTVTFSEAMGTATVNGSTIELRDPSNALVSASVSYNAASLTATLDPTASLAAGVTYTARVRGGGTDPRVKDVAGNALAADVTWSFTTAQNGSGGIKWLVTDHLGSTRMVIDETGSLAGIKRHDFAPFGEELSAGVGIRSASIGYSVDSVRQRFTSKVRDETGLDYFGARYFSSVQGRFTSVDEAPPKLINPQTLNKYRYALNNPLYHIDPDGNQEKKESFLDWLSRLFWERGGWKNDETNPREKPPELVLPGAPPDMSSDELRWKYAQRISEGFDAWNTAIMFIDPTPASSVISIAFDLHQENYGGAALGIITMNRSAGRKFQDKIHLATGIAENTDKIFDPIFRTKSGGRIPDMLDEVNKILGEVKSNKTKIEFRGNLQDFIDYAGTHGYELNLYVRKGAELAPKLKAELKRIGAKVFEYDEKKKQLSQMVLK